jgi:hypothetical protein
METETSVRMRLKVSDNLLDFVRQETIVGVEQREKFASAGSERCIET